MKILIVAVLMLSVVGGSAGAQVRSAVDARPATPPTFAQARTAFLINMTPGPTAEKQFRELRGELQKWDHFRLLNAAKGADVTISLVPGRTLTVRQGATGTVLWVASDKSVKAMVKRMRQQLPPGPSVCVAFWCW
jgi:hypothetical protein